MPVTFRSAARRLPILFFLLLLGVASCSRSSLRMSSVHQPSVTVAPAPAPHVDAQRISHARAELAAATCPRGVDPKTFEQLRTQLDLQLAARLNKSGSALANQTKNTIADAQVVDDGQGGFNLTWTFKNAGDYDSNGEVNISDLTPLGVNLGSNSSSANWASAQKADGDNNGEVNISDMTPIGANFFAQVSGYHIYQSTSASGPWLTLGSVALADATSGFPRRFTYPLGASAPAFILLAAYDAEGNDWAYAAGSGPPALFTPGTVQPGGGATIGSGGGTLDGAAGTPLEGVHIDIPAGALPDGTNVELDYNDGSVTPAAGMADGPIVELSTTDPDNEFEQPIDITMKYSDSANHVPIPYYIEDDGSFEACDIQSIDEANGTYTFSTWHASKYATISAAKTEPSRSSYDTGFTPQSDGFQIVNRGSPYTSGNCVGMSTFAAWYFKKQSKPGTEPPLYSSFMYNTTLGQKGQTVVATRAHLAFSRKWSEYLPLVHAQDSLSEQEVSNIIKNMMVNQSSPVILYLKAPNDSGRDSAHAIVAYAYTPAKISVWDPNTPAPAITPDITADDLGGLNDLVNGGYHFTKFWYLGLGSNKVAEPYADILNAAKAQFQSADATINVQSPQSGSIVATETTPMSFTVDSGDVLVERVKLVIDHRGDDTQEFLTEVPTAGNSYSFNLPLKIGENVVSFTPQGHNSNNGWIDLDCNYDLDLDFSITRKDVTGPYDMKYEIVPTTNPDPLDPGAVAGTFELWVNLTYNGTPMVLKGSAPSLLPSGSGLIDGHTFIIAPGDTKTDSPYFRIRRTDPQPGDAHSAYYFINFYNPNHPNPDLRVRTSEGQIAETAPDDNPHWEDPGFRNGWSTIEGPVSWWTQ